MKFTTELNDNKAKSSEGRWRKCCGTHAKGLNTIENDNAPTTYQIYCKECNTTTAPYETTQEASYAWNNKILM
jgi:hypothetical protein